MPKQRSGKPSSWSKARRDLASPQGSSLVSALIACAIISIIIDIIGSRLGISKSVLYPIILIVDIIIIAGAAIRISAINKKVAEAQQEAYAERFGPELEAAKAWTERKQAEKAGRNKNLDKEEELTYEKAGVSIDTMDTALDGVKDEIKSTYRPEVLSHLGQFGGLFALDKSKYNEPVLVSSTDSVGTKLKIAFSLNRHNTVGYDLVAHCGNDIVVLGAEPLFFLDYLGTSKLKPEVMAELIKGLAAGCKDTGCSLIGGETAELPGFYNPREYDLVGAIVGVVEKSKILTGENIKPGDKLIGLGSVGLHTNGYSLARKIMFDVCGYKVDDFVQELGARVGDELLKPHKSYVKSILHTLEKFNDTQFNIKGIAHITGGGLLDNIPRILPDNCNAVINKNSWNILPVFNFLKDKGNVTEKEMYRVFNMGIGMVLVVDVDYAEPVFQELKSSGENIYNIGEVTQGNGIVTFTE
ncbi:phosphoribosylformylglycinamidine cyclo-ligase [Candidatus Poribacteria bacterium]|nr:phosphoribosylformylglycinamidine cyclo-ligase [Candidatus Poribacteria bacterium]